MNPENINKLADVLEEVQEVVPALFDMSAWGESMLIPIRKRGIPGAGRIEDCGTPGCLAGWTQFLFATFGSINKWPGKFADEFLDLDQHQHCALLLPGKADLTSFGSIHYKDITIPMAVKVLRSFAETGTVDWDVALEEANNDDDEEPE